MENTYSNTQTKWLQQKISRMPRKVCFLFNPRYINFLTLSVDKTSKISHEDLQLFYQKYEEFGPRWTQIQKFLPKM